MKYDDLLIALVLCTISTGLYLAFLGEMGQSSYIPFLDIFFEQSRQLSPASSTVMQSHLEYFSGRLAVPRARLEDSVNTGFTWLLQGEVSCDLLGKLQAMKRVVALDAVTPQPSMASTDYVRTELKQASQDIILLLKFEPSEGYLENLSLRVVQDYRSAVPANVTMDGRCIAATTIDELKLFASEESVTAVIDLVERRNGDAVFRAAVLQGLKEELVG